jgi:hypothetical protein
MRNVSDKPSRENHNTHFRPNNVFFENRAVYKITYENGTTRQATEDNKIRRMRFACRITKATNTHSENVICTAIPVQEWLRKGASNLRVRTLLSCLRYSRYNQGEHSVLSIGMHRTKGCTHIWPSVYCLSCIKAPFVYCLL